MVAGYDPVRQEGVVEFAGIGNIMSGGQTLLALPDTLVLTSQGWVMRPRLSGSPFAVRAMAFDPSTQKLVGACDASRYIQMPFGGTTPYVEFQEWNGNGWNQRLPAEVPDYVSNLVTNPRAGRMVLLDATTPWRYPSGPRFPDHTWTYANGQCVRLQAGYAPSPRADAAMAYDPVRDRIVMFGGEGNGDTWEFDLGPSPSFTQYGTGCVGSRGIPHLQAQTNSVPRTGTTFSARVANLPWNAPTFLLFGLSNTTSSGLPLPFDLGIAGAPGCTLLASIDDIQAMTNVLGTAVWSLAVPTLPGAQFYVQAVAFEPAANALGVVLSNGGHGTLGF